LLNTVHFISLTQHIFLTILSMCRPLNKCRSGQPPRRPTYLYATDYVSR